MALYMYNMTSAPVYGTHTGHGTGNIRYGRASSGHIKKRRCRRTRAIHKRAMLRDFEYPLDLGLYTGRGAAAWYM